MRRIRRTLDRRPSGNGWRLLLRPVAVFALTIGLAATAAAMYGVAHFVQGLDEPAPAESTRLDVPASKASGNPALLRQHSAVQVEPPSTADAPAASSNGAMGELEVGGPAAAPAVPPKRASSEARVVQRSLEALRKDRNPKQAAAYLERYRQEHPDGTLAEEALALAVEAAAANGDPRVKELAVEYLGHYPRGRFRDSARQALANALANDELERQRSRSRTIRRNERATP
jgi:hypothetical protein